VNDPYQFRFDWNSRKAESNIKKHGISFDRAATVFLDPNAISLFDESHSILDEERWTTLGMDRTGTLLVINHTFHDESPTSARIRIISARKASKKEVGDYKEKK